MNFRKVAVSVAMMAACIPAIAAEAEDIIKYRSAVMKAYAGHMSAAARIVRGKVDFNDQLQLHADGLDGIAKTVGTLFPEDSDFGETEAKPEVWSKPKEFADAVKANQQAAAAFNKSVAGGYKAAMGAAFKKLSDSCKSCHEDFRQEKE